MALFKIAKGTKANLPSTKTEGQMYVTTDEPAIYVDTDSNTRLKIGGSSSENDIVIIEIFGSTYS